jgi:hypothetical protein
VIQQLQGVRVLAGEELRVGPVRADPRDPREQLVGRGQPW